LAYIYAGMNVFFRMFFIAAILLLVSKIGVDTLSLQDRAVQTISMGWMDEVPEEEDTIESDDDDDAIGFQALMPFGGGMGLLLPGDPNYAHLLEDKVTTPPPQV
jgi:hypothetical protein